MQDSSSDVDYFIDNKRSDKSGGKSCSKEQKFLIISSVFGFYKTLMYYFSREGFIMSTNETNTNSFAKRFTSLILPIIIAILAYSILIVIQSVYQKSDIKVLKQELLYSSNRYIPKEVLELLEKEKLLASDSMIIPSVSEIYAESAVLIKKINNHELTYYGFSQIEENYRILRRMGFNPYNNFKYNYKMEIIKTNKKNGVEFPAEVILTYDILIKYNVNVNGRSYEKYEQKNGKEVMYLINNDDKWKIKFFYIESN
jgi:hypothetical protein